jgi:hypothetical protein
MKQELPTHRHKITGDIVFWGSHLDPDEYEILPSDHHEVTHKEAKQRGLEKVKREAKFKDWTVEELGAYFEEKFTQLK